MKPRALVIRTAGTNCDAEMVRAFDLAGASCDLLHVDRVIAEPSIIERFDLLGFPGGFSYGDDVASGRVFALRLRERLYPALRSAAERGVCMIGACNGFQVLTQVGLLPGRPTGQWPDAAPTPETALAENAGARFIDRWCRVSADPQSRCVWTRGLPSWGSSHPALMMLPIANGEGRFVAATGVLDRLRESGQVALRYVGSDNPNGSEDGVAGICDPTGRIFGLMPHPERYLAWTLHPFWTALPEHIRRGEAGETPGLRMFRNAVEAAAGTGASVRG
ncbi:MAG: phosphoribosylformylglycinamidine synthase subunit PurQ [Phycisphaerales bacterium]|nr:phosphoribosylformylglycinamidine synthase subunit PurQ [Phycisphaerales bacterium]